MLATLARAVFPLRCPGCGAPAEPVCDECQRALVPPPPAAPPDGVDEWAAAYAYVGVARELVARVKYRRMHGATAWLAETAARVVRPPVPEVVAWVPTTPVRRRERGFDHAELLARAVARRLSRPARRLLARGDGPPQTGLGAAARRVGPEIVPVRASPPTVLLVDDVATTGASLSAAAAALRVAGAARVVALTAARTPAPDVRQ